MGNFTGKTAIITGASRGIGRATAFRLAQDGARVFLAARGQAGLDEAVRRIESSGGSGAALAIDLRMPDAPGKLAEFALTASGRIDIVVNNAGATKRGEFVELSDQDWQDGFALKFYSAVRLTRAAWPHIKTSSGCLVNIVGIGGRTPGSQFAIGGSVNAALLSFTKAMADLGVRDRVRVNAINPGTIRTDRYWPRVQAIANERNISLEEAERRMVQDSRITRIGEPEDIANLVAFIAGPEGSLLQGALIDMDAGATKTI